MKVLTSFNQNLVNVADNSGETPIYIAIKHSRIDLVKHLLDKHANVKIKNKDGLSPFVCACLCGNVDIMEMIEKNGHSVTTDDFISAVKGADLSVVRWFVEKRYFSVNASGVMAAANSTKNERVLHYLRMRGGQFK